MLTQPTQYFRKGVVIDTESGRPPISFQWNPRTISHTKTATWAEMNPIGREQPILQYSIGSAQEISFEMDISEVGGRGQSLRDYVESFITLTKPAVGGNVKRPPKLKLMLGDTLQRTCVLLSVETEYGPMFHFESLGPQQSTIKLRFVEFK